MVEIKEGDRVRLKQDHSATGKVDELWVNDLEVDMASIVWDISGCVGDGPVDGIEPIPVAFKLARPGDWIMTFKGIHFWPLDPRPEEISIEDIAHSLSMQCRWSGQIKRFFSVAEHSYIASLLVPPEHALQALLHDASEAYLVDVPRPVKNMIPEYKRIEITVQSAIFKKYGCNLEMHPSVKQVDDALLMAEADQLMHHNAWKHCEPAAVTLECWHPSLAEAMFLNRARELGVTG